MSYKEDIAFMAAFWAEAEGKPLASFLLTSNRLSDACDLVHVLSAPKDLTKMDLPKRVRLQAERMWRLFGRDIDVSGEVADDGYFHVRGNERHVTALGELLIP